MLAALAQGDPKGRRRVELEALNGQLQVAHDLLPRDPGPCRVQVSVGEFEHGLEGQALRQGPSPRAGLGQRRAPERRPTPPREVEDRHERQLGRAAI